MNELVQGNAAGTPAEFGETVYSVEDKVNGFDAVQQSSSLRPVYYKDPDTQIVGLRFDHVDDRMTQTFPDGFQGDLIVCGTEGSWVDENVVIAAGGDLTIGPKGLPNTPDILPALGDIIGWVPINRAATLEERQAIISYYKSKGAKGLLVEGSELIVNGTFDTDLSGWSFDRASWVDGTAKIEDVAGADGILGQGVAIAENRYAIFKLNVIQNTTSSAGSRTRLGSRLGNNNKGGDLLFGGAGQKRFTVRNPDSNLLWFSFLCSTTDAYFVIDSVSVRELIPEEEL